MTRHQYRISVLASGQTSFRGVSSGGVAKCRLLSQADSTVNVIWIHTHFWVISIVLWKTATLSYCLISSLRKQPTFGNATTGFPDNWRLRNERRNSILMTRHYPDLGSAYDWSCRVGNLISVAKCRLFSQAISFLDHLLKFWAWRKKLVSLQSVLQMTFVKLHDWRFDVQVQNERTKDSIRKLPARIC